MNNSLETVNGERETEILRLRNGLQQTLDDFGGSGKIAGMGSVVGIHLVIVSRSSPDEITDAIKATLPTRLCSQVRSETQSLMVLDDAAAVGLLGRGDMLLMRPSSAVIERVQSAIISEADLTKLVDWVCRRESE